MTSSHKSVFNVVAFCDDDGFSLLIRFDEHVISTLQIGLEVDIIEDDDRSGEVKKKFGRMFKPEQNS